MKDGKEFQNEGNIKEKTRDMNEAKAFQCDPRNHQI